MEIHIKRIENNIIINQKEFQDLLEKIKQIEEIDIIDEDFDDLIQNANSSIDFWDNTIDDEVWNEA
jgi:hypothetical protein